MLERIPMNNGPMMNILWVKVPNINVFVAFFEEMKNVKYSAQFHFLFYLFLLGIFSCHPKLSKMANILLF